MTNELLSFFAALHTLGALIGVGTVTFAEFFYTKAASDGIIDHHERKYLRHLFHGLRFGMSLVLLSSIALIVLEYLVPDAPQDVLAAPFWALQTFTLLVIVLASMLSRKQASWWFASAAILTAWWMMFFIDIGYLDEFGYLTLLLIYVVMTFVVAGVLGYVRILLSPRKASQAPVSEKLSTGGSPK